MGVGIIRVTSNQLLEFLNGAIDIVFRSECDSSSHTVMPKQ